MNIIVICLVIIQIGIVSHAERLSSKLGFEEDTDEEVGKTNEGSKSGDDVEVQHTIVVTTKLKNNNPMINQRGFRETPSSFVNSGSTSRITPLNRRLGYDERPKSEDSDSGEVPIIKGYKAVETTERRSSSRSDIPNVYPDHDSVIIVANIDRDKVDYNGLHPSDLSSVNQWQPSTFFHNINNYVRTPEYFSYDIAKGLNSRSFGQGNMAGSRSFMTPKRTDEHWNSNTYCCRCGQGVRKNIPSWNQPTTAERSTRASVDGKISKPFN